MQKITQIGHIVPNAVFIAVGREKVLKQLYYNPSVSLQSVEVPRVEDFKQNITFEQKKDSLESVRGNVEPEKSFQSFQNVNVNSQDKKTEVLKINYFKVKKIKAELPKDLLVVLCKLKKIPKLIFFFRKFLKYAFKF